MYETNRFIDCYIIYLFISCIFLGLVLGGILRFVNNTVQEILLFMVSFVATLSIPFSKFRSSVNIPLLILMFVFTQLLYPVIVWIYCRVFCSNDGMINDFGVGLILIYSIPCAVSLAIWVILAKGDAGLSFVFVVMDNLIGFMFTPMLMRLYCGKSVEIDSAAIALSLLMEVIIPSLLGILVATLDEARIKRTSKSFLHGLFPYIKLLSRLCLFMVVIISSSRSASSLFSTVSWNYLGLAFSCAFLNFLSFLLSSFLFYLLKKPLDISRESLVAASYGCSMKNCGTSTVFAGLYLPPLSIVPCIIDLIEINIVASLFTKLFDRIVKEEKA